MKDDEQDGGETKWWTRMDVRCSGEQTDMKWNKLMDNNSKQTDQIQLKHTNNKLAQEIRLALTKNKTYKISRFSNFSKYLSFSDITGFQFYVMGLSPSHSSLL